MLEYYGIVYKATNILNGKCYIGITTKGLAYRRRQHLKAKNPGYFQKHLRAHPDNFVWSIIDTAKDREELNNKEIYYIDKFKSYNLAFGYNRTSGGENGAHGISLKEVSVLSQGIPVVCVEENLLFRSSTEAEEYFGVTSIHHAVKTGGISYGYHWRKASAEEILTITPVNITTKITAEEQERMRQAIERHRNEIIAHAAQTSTGKPSPRRKLVMCIETRKIFTSCSQAIALYKSESIKACCQGKTKTALGYHWKYVSFIPKGTSVIEAEDEKEIRTVDINKLKYTYKERKPISKYKVLDLDTGVLYTSVRNASIQLGISMGGIYSCCEREAHGKSSRLKAVYV